jgi:L-alanine-DL-glutamate epimerase-like enolase superfamily enzyme
MYDRLADLKLEIEGYSLEPLQLDTPGGWTRRTTVVRLFGEGEAGLGEDVTYQGDEQAAFQAQGPVLPLQGSTTLDRFSNLLEGLDLFPAPPDSPASRNYRRWAFESAALDLALRQNRTTMAKALGRSCHPVRFAVSLGLGGPPSTARIRTILKICPGMQFKIDLSDSWTAETIRELAALDAVAVVDLKGQYRGSFKGPAADPDRYRLVATGLPDAWIEDPAWEAEPAAALGPYGARVTWDAILHSESDIDALPFKPRCINIKPSRFGPLSELLAVYRYCESRGIRMYGGGQFELGPGRGQIQYLASLFHADEANDVAPSIYNSRDLPAELPASPLKPSPDRFGFRWSS